MDHVFKLHLILMKKTDNLIADVFTAEKDVRLDPISGDPLGIGGEKGGFADVFQLEKRHGKPFEPHAETTVRGHPVFEDAQIVGEVGRIHLFHPNPFDHRLVRIPPLSARSDFRASAKEVERVGEIGVFRHWVGVEGALYGFPVGNEDEIGAVFFKGPGAKIALCSGT